MYFWEFLKVSWSRKEILVSSILPKNELENVNFCPSLLRQKFFVHFLGELKKTKNPLEINRSWAWIVKRFNHQIYLYIISKLCSIVEHPEAKIEKLSLLFRPQNQLLVRKYLANFIHCVLWQYELWSCQAGGTKLERFLPEDQQDQRKLLNFENWVNGEVSKIGHHFGK